MHDSLTKLVHIEHVMKELMKRIYNLETFGKKNTIYIRDRERVISKIVNSRKILVQDRII